MLPRDPQNPNLLRVSGSGSANHLHRHLVEDFHAHSQFYDGGTGYGEAGCRAVMD